MLIFKNGNNTTDEWKYYYVVDDNNPSYQQMLYFDGKTVETYDLYTSTEILKFVASGSWCVVSDKEFNETVENKKIFNRGDTFKVKYLSGGYMCTDDVYILTQDNKLFSIDGINKGEEFKNSSVTLTKKPTIKDIREFFGKFYSVNYINVKLEVL